MIHGFCYLFFSALLLGLSGCTTSRTDSPKRATSRPYTIKGIRYYPQSHYELDQVGIASYYGENDKTHGCLTACGERFHAYQMTAAHKTLPLPCLVKVTNLENGRQVILKVNDRGPYKYRRILDVSVMAAKKLGFYRKGLARVRVQTLVKKSLAMQNGWSPKKDYFTRVGHAHQVKPRKRIYKKVRAVRRKKQRSYRDFILA